MGSRRNGVSGSRGGKNYRSLQVAHDGYRASRGVEPGTAYDGRKGNRGADEGGQLRRLSRSERRRRRRKRIIKAVTAWLVCIFFVALIALGTAKGITELSSSKQRQFRQEGIERLEAGDYAGAIESLDAALEKAGKRSADFQADVLKYRAEAELRLKDYDAVAYTCDLVLELEPEALSYGYLKSTCLALKGDTEEARSIYRNTLAKDKQGEYAPGREQALVAVGSACVTKGEFRQAMALYQEALGEGTENGQIYNQMGICQMAESDYEGAGDSFDKGIQALAALYGTGTQLSQLKAAIPAEEAERGSILKELSYNRAVVREYLQQYQEAKSLFEEYINVFGEDEDARHELDFLETR